MNKQLQAYKQQLVSDINGTRPVMIPDENGGWVSRIDAEHLAEQLEQAKLRIKQLTGQRETLIADLKAKALEAVGDDWGYSSDIFHEAATPGSILKLIDELEQAQKRIAELEDVLSSLSGGER